MITNEEKLRRDVRQLAGSMTLSLRSIQIALLSMKTDDDASFNRQMKDIDKYIGEIWEVYEKNIGTGDK